MNTKTMRALCEKILIPLLADTVVPRLVDIRDELDIGNAELARIGQRLDDIDAHLCRDVGED